ncbi:sialidase family protein [Noviherbaspirillum sedimenti]|uniref:Exo-alpha-sialidase n=1 Tax=Noviherbaspirillum sedimenti TaxID=2320865 RepID=A0A3A3G4K4_9BURK|nr:sialidase family protein [Noviherbaspirillum sedimenti]RJG02861.1 exo-alpha-sialidase [Noviherbaspirillum sedimenti]
MHTRISPSSIVVFFLLLAAVVTPTNVPAQVRWHGVIEIAAGRGDKGPWRQNDSAYDYVDDPAVAIHASGDMAVIWIDQQRKDVFFQNISRDGTRQDVPVNVSRNPATFSWLPRLVVAPEDTKRIYILWQEIIFSGGSHGGDILFAYSEDAGKSFSAPRNLSASMAGDGKGRLNRDVWSNGSLDLAMDGNGILYVAWTEYEGKLWFARSTDGGKNFSHPRSITGGPLQPARAPSLAPGPGQTVYLAWTVGEDPAADIRVARSGDGGNTFGQPQRVGAGKGHADAPKLALDPGGTLHVVYAESSNGPFGRYHIRHARSADHGKTFGAPQVISARPANAPAGAGYPALAIDAQGRLFVIWEMFPAPGAAPRGLAFAVSSNGGKTFTAPAMVPGSVDPAGGANGSQQGLLTKKLAVNAAGAIAAVNSSLKHNERSRVWLMRGEWDRQAIR